MNREKQKIAELNEQNKEIYLQTKLFLRRDVKKRSERQSVLDSFFELLKDAQEKGLSPEELFPEGYDAFYGDLISGLTVYPAREKRKRILRVRTAAICLAVLAAGTILWQYLTAQGYIGVWTDGIGYIATNFNDYSYEEHVLTEDVSFEVDFRRWEEYGDEVIYRNGKLTIELSNLDESVGRYRIFFRFRGIYSRDSATLVSWRNYGVDQSHNGEWKQTAELFCDYNGESRSCKLAGFSYLNYKDGETMGFFVPETITPATRAGVVQFRLHNLTMSRWERREDISVGG